MASVWRRPAWTLDCKLRGDNTRTVTAEEGWSISHWGAQTHFTFTLVQRYPPYPTRVSKVIVWAMSPLLGVR